MVTAPREGTRDRPRKGIPPRHSRGTMTTKLLVWDFDGTLIDSHPQILAGMNHTLAGLGLPPEVGGPVRERWLKCVGLPVEAGLEAAFSPLGLAWETVYPVYRSFDWAGHEHLLRPFPGMEALVAELRDLGAPMAIATSKRGASLRRQLALFGWEHTFSPLVTPDEVAQGKPDPESLHQILAATGFAPEEALMIGDTPFDLDMARRAGVPSLAVGHGFYGQEDLLAWDPVGFAPDVPALRDQLLARLER